MRLSLEQELNLAADEVVEEVFDEDHLGDAAAVAAVAQNGGRTTAQAIALLVAAVISLAEENTADAQIAVAALLAASKYLNDKAIATVAEATVAQLVNELETQGPVAFFMKLLGFHNGGVVSP